MGALTTAMLAGGVLQGASRKHAADIAAAQEDAAADRLDAQAGEVARAGQDSLASYTEKARKFMAASEASVARRHIDLGSGLADAVRKENQRVAGMDLLTMQNNITADVLKYRFAAAQRKTQAALTRSAGRKAFLRSVLSGAVKGAAQSKMVADWFTETPDLKKVGTGVKTLSSLNKQTKTLGEMDEDTIGIAGADSSLYDSLGEY